MWCLSAEELEHAKARGANIYAELVGYGATSDGVDMVPSGEGAFRCMKMALSGINDPVDYKYSWDEYPIGDTKELEAILEVLEQMQFPI